eukprot:6173287-Pleurochrysis_carterae.AAC.2
MFISLSLRMLPTPLCSMLFRSQPTLALHLARSGRMLATMALLLKTHFVWVAATAAAVVRLGVAAVVLVLVGVVKTAGAAAVVIIFVAAVVCFTVVVAAITASSSALST